MQAEPNKDLSNEELESLRKDYGDFIKNWVPYEETVFNKALDDDRIEKIEVKKFKVGDFVVVNGVECEIIAIKKTDLKLKTKEAGAIFFMNKKELQDE